MTTTNLRWNPINPLKKKKEKKSISFADDNRIKKASETPMDHLFINQMNYKILFQLKR